MCYLLNVHYITRYFYCVCGYGQLGLCTLRSGAELLQYECSNQKPIYKKATQKKRVSSESDFALFNWTGRKRGGK